MGSVNRENAENVVDEADEVGAEGVDEVEGRVVVALEMELQQGNPPVNLSEMPPSKLPLRTQSVIGEDRIGGVRIHTLHRK